MKGKRVSTLNVSVEHLLAVAMEEAFDQLLHKALDVLLCEPLAMHTNEPSEIVVHVLDHHRELLTSYTVVRQALLGMVSMESKTLRVSNMNSGTAERTARAGHTLICDDVLQAKHVAVVRHSEDFDLSNSCNRYLRLMLVCGESPVERRQAEPRSPQNHEMKTEPERRCTYTLVLVGEPYLLEGYDFSSALVACLVYLAVCALAHED